MDELRKRAQLVGLDSAGAGEGAVGTVITRAEVAETAMRGEFPATLILDIDRIAIDWDEESLEQLLASTDGPEIALWFDEAGLAEAFDEVESHGLREKAAVLAVAATAAGAAAAPSFGAVYGGGGSGGGSQPTATGHPAVVVPTGAERGLQQDEQIVVTPTQGTSGGGSVTSSGDSSGLSTGEIAGVAAGAILLISAAGFGVSHKRQPPALPA